MILSTLICILSAAQTVLVNGTKDRGMKGRFLRPHSQINPDSGASKCLIRIVLSTFPPTPHSPTRKKVTYILVCWIKHGRNLLFEYITISSDAPPLIDQYSMHKISQETTITVLNLANNERNWSISQRICWPLFRTFFIKTMKSAPTVQYKANVCMDNPSKDCQ